MTPRKIFHTCLAATSTVALVIGVARLAPIAESALKVNECIKESSINGDINMSYRDKFKGRSSG